MTIITFKFATPYEQHVGWGNNINLFFMRDQHSQPLTSNMLFGVITSTLSSSGIKIRHPYEQYFNWGNNINFIFIRDQHLPPPVNNVLIGGNNINFIFIATWSRTRRNVRVAANMYKPFLWDLKPPTENRWHLLLSRSTWGDKASHPLECDPTRWKKAKLWVGL